MRAVLLALSLFFFSVSVSASVAAENPRLRILRFLSYEAPSTNDKYANAVMDLFPTMSWRVGEDAGLTAEEENDNYDGTYTNGVTLGVASLVTNSTNTAISLASASSQYVTMSPINAGTTWSIVAWVNTSDTSAYQIPFHAVENTGSFNGMALQIAITTGYLQGMTTDNTPGNSTWASTYNVADGNDYQIAATFGVGGSASLYVNGSVVASFSGQRIVSAATNPVSVDIGRRPDGFYMNGIVDDVAFWAGADIGASAVADLWAASQ